MTFYIYGAKRPGRAEVLAGSAAYAPLGINRRNPRGIFPGRVGFNHRDSPNGTVSGAIPALHPVSKRQAIFSNPHRVAYLYGGFLLFSDSLNSSRRAHFGAFGALRSAVTILVRGFRLHQGLESGRRPQNLVRAYRHAELARCAVSG